MKQIFIAVVLMMFAGMVSATGTLPPVPVTVVNFPTAQASWVASGFESVTQAGNQTVYFLPISESGFATEDLCNDFLSGRRALALGLAANSKPQTRKVDADCYPQTSVPE